jgi:ABC-2 type transport system ATP-binding protein
MLERILRRFGALQPSTAGVAVRLDGQGDLADIVRALDAAEVRVADLHLHAPTLDDVFLAKTGRSLEGSGEEEPEPE